MSREIELLTEIRDLLQVMAEPSLAQREEKFRDAVRAVGAKSPQRCAAIMLMDGSRSQTAIGKEADLDQSTVSRLVKALSAQSLITADEKHPKLRTKLPLNFFDHKGKTHE